MKWNWELPDWPQFTYDPDRISQLERQFLLSVGSACAYLKTIDTQEYTRFIVEILSDEGVESSKIEGEFLDRESLQSSIKQHFGLPTTVERRTDKESRMAQLLCSVYESFDKPLTHEMLWQWHSMLFNDSTSIDDRGKYRTHTEPMQIVSHRYGAPRIFFEAPPSSRVFQEMEGFVDWFNLETAVGPRQKVQDFESESLTIGVEHSQKVKATPRVSDYGSKDCAFCPDPTAVSRFNSTNGSGSILGRAAIAHVYFESIHPFEDGNGRIGRIVAEKILSQGIGRPILTAVSKLLEKRKKEYYIALEHCNRTLEVDKWVEFFANVVVQALEESMSLLSFLIEKSKMLTFLSEQISPRQMKALLRMFAQGPSGFAGGMSAEKYIAITKASRATATRDLTDLVEKGALVKSGELRHTRYRLNLNFHIGLKSP